MTIIMAHEIQVEKGRMEMYKKVIFAVLMISVFGCTALKQRFGTGEETPELKAARAECRAQAAKEAAQYDNSIKRKDYNRVVYDACMEKKGYNQYGKKVK